MSTIDSDFDLTTESDDGVSIRPEYHVISDAVDRGITTYRAAGKLSITQAETMRTMLRTAVLIEDTVLSQIDKLSSKKLSYLLSDGNEPEQISIEELRNAIQYYEKKHGISIYLNGFSDTELLRNMKLGSKFGISYIQSIRLLKQYIQKYKNSCLNYIDDVDTLKRFKPYKLLECFKETSSSYINLIYQQSILHEFLLRPEHSEDDKRINIQGFQDFFENALFDFKLKYLSDYFTENFDEAKLQVEQCLEFDGMFPSIVIEPFKGLVNMAAPSEAEVSGYLLSLPKYIINEMFDQMHPILIAHFDQDQDLYSKLRDPNFIAHEILNIQSNPEIPKPTAYVFSYYRAYGYTHIEAFIITDKEIISPIYYPEASLLVARIEALQGRPICSAAYYSQETRIQADPFSCGTFTLLMIKELLKNKAALLNKFDLNIQEFLGTNIFIPPPQLLRYSQSTRYIQMIEYLITSDTYNSSKDIEPLILQLKSKNANTLLIRSYNEFRTRWLSDFRLHSPTYRLMYKDGKNCYIALRSIDIIRHAKEEEESKEEKHSRVTLRIK